MCGIAGLIGRSPGSFADRVGPALAHRGPDDSGSWRNDRCCLVHRRLAILDLSPAGHQPMRSACGRWLLVFNGEIYNHQELRRELAAEGHRFRSSGDTDVLLAWLISRGEAGLSRLRGMAAFCLYDSQEHTALLARDPHGIKPLYFWQGERGELAFASELRALLASGLPARRLDQQALGSYLATGSVAEPATLVAGIQRLPAGHWARWSRGALQVAPWSPLPESLASPALMPPPAAMAEADAVAIARAALEESVAAHMISDVPVGLFLSGGLDSAALLALAPPGLRTFTIGFPEAGAEGFDESAPAARIAADFGAEHTVLPLAADQARAWLPAFLASQDQPSNDGFNTWCVSRLAAERGLKVALSGLGGDELFGGYASFDNVPRLRRWRGRIGPAGPALAGLLRRSPVGGRQKAQRLGAWLEAPPSLARAYRAQRGFFSPREVDRLLRHWGGDGPVWRWDPGELLEPPSDLQGREAVAWLEGSRYLRNQLLPDSDVMAMAAGLELRLPLVDATLQSRLAAIPAALRLQPQKALLRQAVPELPDWFTDRPKQGFRFPFQLWLDSPGNDLASRIPPVPGGLDLRPWYRRWTLMVLDHWLRQWLGLSLADRPLRGGGSRGDHHA
jgi:asparagine synthase (glutamine-hydrolysing)